MGRKEIQIRKITNNSVLSVQVLQKSLNLVILRFGGCCFAEKDKEMYQNILCTFRGVVFAHNETRPVSHWIKAVF